MKRIFLILFLVGTCVCTRAQVNVVYMTSLTWPPYTGEDLNQQGGSIAVAKAAFKVMDYDLVVDFFPWSRAVRLGLEPSTKYLGVFPEYYSAQINQNCFLSNAIGSGPLGFAQLKAKPVLWQSLGDIAKLASVGVVQDYVNSKSFDAKVAKGEINVDIAISDVMNLKKLGAGRTSLVVIDEYVMNFILNNDPFFKRLKNKIEFNEKILEDKKLFLCFKRTDRAKEVRDVFNLGLQRINIEKVFTKALK